MSIGTIYPGNMPDDENMDHVVPESDKNIHWVCLRAGTGS